MGVMISSQNKTTEVLHVSTVLFFLHYRKASATLLNYDIQKETYVNDGVDGVKGEEISEESKESREDQHYPGDVCTVSRRCQEQTHESRRNEQQQAIKSDTPV